MVKENFGIDEVKQLNCPEQMDKIFEPMGSNSCMAKENFKWLKNGYIKIKRLAHKLQI